MQATFWHWHRFFKYVLCRLNDDDLLRKPYVKTKPPWAQLFQTIG